MKSVLKAAVAALMIGVASPALADIKIGSTVSETGPASSLGDPEAKTLRMLVDEINAAGGVLGEKIELVSYDDAGDPNKARTFATRLIEDDEVVAIVGGSTTATTMSIMQVVADAEIPFISLAGALEIVDPVQPWTFKTPHTDRMACGKIFENMKAGGLTKIGLISGSDGFGASMRKHCVDIAGDYGIEILADEIYGPTDADMTPQLTNLRSKEGVQAILNAGFGQGPAIVTRNYGQLGIKTPLYQSHGVASKAFIELAGPASNGVKIPGTAILIADQLSQDDPQYAVVTAYRKIYEEKAGSPASTFGGYAHDALRLLVDAINRAGAAEPQAIRDAIEQTKGFVGVTGAFNMSATDHLGLDLSAFRMLEIKDGNWVLLQ